MKDITEGLNYAVLAISTNEPPEVLHACMFENPPALQNYMYMIYELARDPEFGMVELKAGVDYYLELANDEQTKVIREEVVSGNVYTRMDEVDENGPIGDNV